ncbi:MAG: redoxin domain-containing protein [Planctomycetes bacterium]|nr:redoxin domain-containing protein [Planctomycetota bacterium]
MAIRVLWFFILCAAVTTRSVMGGEFNEVLSIGDAAPNWVELPGTDGKQHSLDDYKNKAIVVLAFTSVSCETAVEYEDRINDLAKRLGGPDGKVAVVAVCVNRVKGDELPDLTERARKRGFAFDYLHDESQKIAKDYGVIFTPEFYVLGPDRKIVYMGAFDDKTDPSLVMTRHVEQAITAVLNGQSPEIKETAPRGCRVRWFMKKRTRQK